MLTRILLLTIWCLLFAATAFAQDSSARLLVLSKTQARLLIVDPVAKKIVAEVPTGTGPHEVTASEDGKLAFVSNYGEQTPGDSLSVIDLTTGKELHRRNLGALRRPHGIVASHGRVYFTAE